MKTREQIMQMVNNAPPHFKLWPIEGLTSAILCGTGPHYVSELHGPFYDVTDGMDGEGVADLRIFVQYRCLRGTTTLHFLVQDADDDAFLNAGVVEKYDVGPVVYR